MNKGIVDIIVENPELLKQVQSYGTMDAFKDVASYALQPWKRMPKKPDISKYKSLAEMPPEIKEKLINWVGETAMSAQVGGLIAGKTAKMIPKGLRFAEALEKGGMKMDDIHLETGWRRGKYDPEWRFEIDDSKMRVKPLVDILDDISMRSLEKSNYATTRLGKLIEHDELFKQYPGAKDIVVYIQKGKQGASFDPVEGAIRIGESTDKSTLIHEIQHAIQEIEGFPKGGSFQNMMRASYEKRLNQLIAEDSHTVDSIPAHRLMELEKRAAHEAYTKLAGEIEARMAAERMAFTPEQRRAIPWYQNTPSKGQAIVRY